MPQTPRCPTRQVPLALPRAARRDPAAAVRLGVLLGVLACACDAATSAPAGATAGDGSVGPADGAQAGNSDTDSAAPLPVILPPANAPFDYQLGGAYPPPAGVGVLSRDRQEDPVSGIYSICYINGFQIQPAELSTWNSKYPSLILRDGSGSPIIDTNWNEALIDVSTAEKRAAVANLVGAWVDACTAKGFQAVEFDNLDSYLRSGGQLSENDSVAMMQLLTQHAHAKGLAVAQKNAAELVPRKADMGTDFAIAEECNAFHECDAYRAGYGDRVFVIEYRRQAFTEGCAQYPNLSIVLRDRNLVTPSTPGYLRDGC